MGKPTIGRPATTSAMKSGTSAGGIVKSDNYRGRRIAAARANAKLNGVHINDLNVLRRRNQKNAIYTKNWLLAADSAKKPFAEELFTTTFSKENIEKSVNALKVATENEVSESPRLLKDDYLYSVQIVSHRTPHIPVHLSRM